MKMTYFSQGSLPKILHNGNCLMVTGSQVVVAMAFIVSIP